MTTTPEEPTGGLADEDMATTGSEPNAGATPGPADADGTDGTATGDADGTDGGDADGTDGDATDTTDGDSTEAGGDADGTDADGTDGTDG